LKSRPGLLPVWQEHNRPRLVPVMLTTYENACKMLYWWRLASRFLNPWTHFETYISPRMDRW